jgi:hypothetical protein
MSRLEAEQVRRIQFGMYVKGRVIKSNTPTNLNIDPDSTQFFDNYQIKTSHYLLTHIKKKTLHMNQLTANKRDLQTNLKPC